jgi:hypothetical protein
MDEPSPENCAPGEPLLRGVRRGRGARLQPAGLPAATSRGLVFRCAPARGRAGLGGALPNSDWARGRLFAPSHAKPNRTAIVNANVVDASSSTA